MLLRLGFRTLVFMCVSFDLVLSLRTLASSLALSDMISWALDGLSRSEWVTPAFLLNGMIMVLDVMVYLSSVPILVVLCGHIMMLVSCLQLFCDMRSSLAIDELRERMICLRVLAAMWLVLSRVAN